MKLRKMFFFLISFSLVYPPSFYTAFATPGDQENLPPSAYAKKKAAEKKAVTPESKDTPAKRVASKSAVVEKQKPSSRPLQTSLLLPGPAVLLIVKCMEGDELLEKRLVSRLFNENAIEVAKERAPHSFFMKPMNLIENPCIRYCYMCREDDIFNFIIRVAGHVKDMSSSLENIFRTSSDAEKIRSKVLKLRNGFPKDSLGYKLGTNVAMILSGVVQKESLDEDLFCAAMEEGHAWEVDVVSLLLSMGAKMVEKIPDVWKDKFADMAAQERPPLLRAKNLRESSAIRAALGDSHNHVWLQNLSFVKQFIKRSKPEEIAEINRLALDYLEKAPALSPDDKERMLRFISQGSIDDIQKAEKILRRSICAVFSTIEDTRLLRTLWKEALENPNISQSLVIERFVFWSNFTANSEGATLENGRTPRNALAQIDPGQAKIWAECVTTVPGATLDDKRFARQFSIQVKDETNAEKWAEIVANDLEATLDDKIWASNICKVPEKKRKWAEAATKTEGATLADTKRAMDLHKDGNEEDRKKAADWNSTLEQAAREWKPMEDAPSLVERRAIRKYCIEHRYQEEIIRTWAESAASHSEATRDDAIEARLSCTRLGDEEGAKKWQSLVNKLTRYYQRG